jgi:hypothetical protein
MSHEEKIQVVPYDAENSKMVKRIGFREVEKDTPPDVKKQKSMDTVQSGGSLGGEGGKLVDDSLLRKVTFLTSVIIAVASNVGLMVLLIVLRSEEGFHIHFHELEIPLEQITPILLVSTMMVVYATTYMGFTDSIAVLSGRLLVRPQGYPISIIGYVQSSFWEKWMFQSKLPHGRTHSRFIGRIQIIYLFQVSFIVLLIPAALEINSSWRNIEDGTKSCLVYHQRGPQSDRGWPTVHVSMGQAANLFGNTLGVLRSQQAVENTTFVVGPQIISSGNTMLVGDGFTMKISTQCSCVPSLQEIHVVGIPQADIRAFVNATQSLGLAMGLVHGLYYVNNRLLIQTVLSQTQVCGERKRNPVIPICTTVFSDLKHAQIRVDYQHDGFSSTSIAQKVTVEREESAADMAWFFQGFQWFFGDRITAIEVPQGRNMINPLLWWATSTEQDISPSLIEEGLETMFAIQSKTVMQRTFLTKGTSCRQIVTLLDEVTSRLTPTGAWILTSFCIGQGAVQLICICIGIAWILEKEVSFPAVELVKYPSAIMGYLQSNNLLPRIEELGGNHEEGTFWPRMDITLRLAECISTIDDPERGKLVLDKPKLVSAISRTKIF